MNKSARHITCLFLAMLLGAWFATAADISETLLSAATAPTNEITAEEDAVMSAKEPPPIPPGYKDENEIMMAILAGKVELLSPLKPIPVPDSVIEIKDIEYGRVGDRPLQLDLYVPKEIKKPVPALIFIHGGGWSSGHRTDYKYYTVRFAARGYVAATVSYRFVQETPFPACVQDVKCAVRWMRANAEQYHVNPDKIAAIGGSAGGHLSLMLGYSAGVPELEGDGGHAEYSSAVQAVVDLYGPYNLTLDLPARDHPLLVNFFGGKRYNEVPDQYALGSPSTHLDESDPPTLVFQGTIDDLVPVEQSDLLVEDLKRLGIPSVYERYDGYPHAMDVAMRVNWRCQWMMLRFFEKYLPFDQ